jgi:hypothetical protein
MGRIGRAGVTSRAAGCFDRPWFRRAIPRPHRVCRTETCQPTTSARSVAAPVNSEHEMEWRHSRKTVDHAQHGGCSTDGLFLVGSCSVTGPHQGDTAPAATTNLTAGTIASTSVPTRTAPGNDATGTAGITTSATRPAITAANCRGDGGDQQAPPQAPPIDDRDRVDPGTRSRHEDRGRVPNWSSISMWSGDDGADRASRAAGRDLARAR